MEIRKVQPDDLNALVELEKLCFESDRLSRRSFQRWVKGDSSILLVLTVEDVLVGYGLVLLHRGTRLARVYSLALNPATRGRGYGRQLLIALEAAALESGRLFMRLEVSKVNTAAIALYRSLQYREFDELESYYEDGTDAVRMQKRIRYPDRADAKRIVPWYRQTTSFSCGPASVMMAMGAIDTGIELNQMLELDLWREATTIFMTSGHGGCHPVGLALAAQRRGFSVRVCMNQMTPLFTDGVRAAHKKEILAVVHEQFLAQAEAAGLEIEQSVVSTSRIDAWLEAGCSVIALISSYRLNGDKAPHWVVVTASDELCFYVHDPDAEKVTLSEIDCQHIPIAKEEFAQMLVFGSKRFTAAVVFERRGG
ncbi:MAG: GNAT family N-acetyltransferase/peptidase C39 family protein [Verrucomicrobiales bacterium]|nr:GNAT family N-acetyltransferase/peptidase C39 family protein [Verrucomicrobiales bacterium]